MSSFEISAVVACALAAIPCLLFLLNLTVYWRLPITGKTGDAISVLIPARNEETNLPATLAAVLANRGVEFEVIVLDDHSTDGTAALLAAMAKDHPRLRVEMAPPLPAGWCGKQHACHTLAKLARHPLLVFIDADVILACDALARFAGAMRSTRASLISGVPHQKLGTFSERLLLPLIHFVLLGFLPMPAMRRTRWPAMSAGCGQLFVARRDDYQHAGGHAKLRDSLHDGLKLPRAFRKAGFHTDLFDATDVATCRMYHTNSETWQGLGKNATEGLAAPGTIVPMTLLLLGGQVMPFLLTAMLPFQSAASVPWAVAGVALAYLPRVIAAKLFRQPLGSAFLHPLGVLALLFIQWKALYRHCLGKPSIWKGRSYTTSFPTDTVHS